MTFKFLRDDGTFASFGSSVATAGAIQTLYSATNATSVSNNTTTFVPVVSVAQGSAGTWFVSGTVSLFSSVAGTPTPMVYLWSSSSTAAGALISQTQVTLSVVFGVSTASLSGIATSPSGGLSLLFNAAAAGSITWAINGQNNITAIRMG